jgi:hypothetical protein
MKTNNNTNNGGIIRVRLSVVNISNLTSGFLCGVTNTSCPSGDWRQSYANKIVKYIKDYAARGITVNYVGFLNEPDLMYVQWVTL